MSVAISQFSVPKPSSSVHGHFNPRRTKPIPSVIRCSTNKRVRATSKTDQNHNYYELLGVSVDSTPQQIKGAYRKLQKKHHPDVAGKKGHEHALQLNEAYKVLMREDLRRDYDASIGQTRVSFGRNRPAGLGYSSWDGPLRPKALFVDENACIGCKECVHHAGNTFVMDDAMGCARVKVQYGDDEKNIEVSVDSCPVNCIHWVEREELAVLEFLIRPQKKEGYGVFGGGWERPKNVFMAAKAFNKQLEREAETNSHVRSSVDEETPAQAEARAEASMKLKTERLSSLLNWVKEVLGS